MLYFMFSKSQMGAELRTISIYFLRQTPVNVMRFPLAFPTVSESHSLWDELESCVWQPHVIHEPLTASPRLHVSHEYTTCVMSSFGGANISGSLVDS